MKTTWSSIVVAAGFLQLGGLPSVRADDCTNNPITCPADTVDKSPLPSVTCDSTPCGDGECCAETCALYGGGCANEFFGPVLASTVCYIGGSGVCDFASCCVWHESCTVYDGVNDCPTDTVRTYDPAATCDGVCDITGDGATCCPVATCGNSFDYSQANACASGEGPALSSTACPAGGCDPVAAQTTCCKPHVSCSTLTAAVCADTVLFNAAEVCDGECANTAVDGYDFACCSAKTCKYEFNSRDCSTGTYDDSVVCTGVCDEATCCP